jgi:NTP pyrophosphatase (non-canonical NTP hydrolase)
MNNDTLMKDLLYHDGRNKYISKIVEELSELSVAILHYEQGRNVAIDVMAEVADVGIQLEKIIALLREDGRLNIEENIEVFTEQTKSFLEGYIYGIQDPVPK